MEIELDHHTDLETTSQDFFDQNPRILVITLVIMFLLAGLIRLYRIEAPGMLVEREYTSALFSRVFYLEQAANVEEWRREIASIIKQNQPILEPPITEFLVSRMYLAFNDEQIWYARILISSFWLLGGVFLYQIVKTQVSSTGAVYAAGYYLFVPLGILVSRSFQADALMMMLYLICLFCILRFLDKQASAWLIAAAFFTGLTLLYRPLVFFSTYSVILAITVVKSGNLKSLFEKKLLFLMIASLLPALIYYGYGIVIAGYLRWKIDSSFRPYLFLDRSFWEDWFLIAIDAVGLPTLMAALIGAPMLRKGVPRSLVSGLIFGYIIFGLVFTFHIHTHGYYHIQLIPIVGLSSAALISYLINYLRQLENKWYWWLPVIAALFLGLFYSLLEVRSRLGSQVFEPPWVASEIGEIVNHGDKNVFIAYHYGLPLQYYGELSGAFWPRRITSERYRRPDEQELSVEERLNGLDFSPEYFIITHFNEFNQHHTDLKEYLVDNCSLIAESDQYLIYGACLY
jgi:hypothetical protein